jgi:hypothetical protein
MYFTNQSMPNSMILIPEGGGGYQVIKKGNNYLDSPIGLGR